MSIREDQVRLLASLQERVRGALIADERISALWLGGSLGRREGDWLSDVDLVVVSRDGRSEELAEGLEELLVGVGRVALAHDAPQNAPANGRHSNVLFDTEPLPTYIDWNIWPHIDQRPSDVSVVFEHEPMEQVQATFAELLNGLPRKSVTKKTEREFDHFRVFMTPILIKHAARGWFDGVGEILAYMRVEATRVSSLDEALALTEAVLLAHGRDEPAETLDAIRRYARIVRQASRSGPTTIGR